MTSYETLIDEGRAKSAIIIHSDVLVSEMASVAWLQNDVAEENQQDGAKANLHQYVDLAEGDNMAITKNWLRRAHSECERLLEGLLLPIGASMLTLRNTKAEDSDFVTEIALKQHMRNSDAELIAYTMHYYMMHYALREWAALAAPAFTAYWNDALAADSRQLQYLNAKRNRVSTTRKMSDL